MTRSIDLTRVEALHALARRTRDRALARDRGGLVPRGCLDEAIRDGITARRVLSEELLEAMRVKRELDEARAKLAETEQFLREREAEREALCERVSVLEEERDDAKRTRSLLYMARADLEVAITERDEARERLAREQRRSSDRLDVDVLVGGASMHGADDALWRPGETRAECWARHIREAEERGARWAIKAWTRRAYLGAYDDAGRAAEAARICDEARKAGEHG